MKTYEIRFWNANNENIKVAGKYSHSFDSYEDAINGANAFLNNAYKLGAVSMDINNDFYHIIND